MPTNSKKPKAEQSTWSLIKEAVPVFASLTGLFVAIFWVYGRSYAAGYFDAMNIPSYHVAFSVFEYAETVWWLVGLISFTFTLILVFFLILGETLFYLLREKIKSILGKKKIKNAFLKALVLVVDKYEKVYSFSLWGMFVVLIIMYSASKVAYPLGNNLGKANIAGKGTQVELILTFPLDKNTQAQILSNNKTNSYYIYQDLKLLTYNNGKYYLFRELDPQTCKPRDVYIIDEANLIQVTLKPGNMSDVACGKDTKLVTQPTATITPSQTATP